MLVPVSFAEHFQYCPILRIKTLHKRECRPAVFVLLRIDLTSQKTDSPDDVRQYVAMTWAACRLTQALADDAPASAAGW